MNDSILNELRILIERTVRPVRATTARKRKMREELLAHLVAAYDEEASRDAAAALNRTRERFGDVGALTQQLQQSVPAKDRLFAFLERWIGFATREPAWRGALRLALLVGLFCAVGFVCITPFMPDWTERTFLVKLPSLLSPVFMAGLAFWGALLVHGMRHALYGRPGTSWWRAVVIGVLSWTLVPLCTFLWCAVLSTQMTFAANEVWPLLLWALPAPLALLMIVRMAEPELRYEEEWGNLDIDRQAGAAS